MCICNYSLKCFENDFVNGIFAPQTNKPTKNEIWNYYDVLDISVVPSTEPEPFGLVATESMLSMKPVVAANHGGLSEIIVNNETGFFFEQLKQIQLSLDGIFEEESQNDKKTK